MQIKSDIPWLVHFFGPDGSGKTVQADILVGVLNKRGFKAKKCWLRAHHTVAFIFWKILVKIGFYRTTRNFLGVETKIPAVDRSKLMRNLWSMIELISVMPHVLRLHLSLSRGYRIVAERYLLDTITAVAYVTGDIGFVTSRVARTICRFIPEKTAFIYLDSDYETILRRRMPASVEGDGKKNREHSQDDSKENYIEPQSFIEFQRTAYGILANSFMALVIDTSKTSIERTSETVKQYLGLAQ